jgi:hypothetical protein
MGNEIAGCLLVKLFALHTTCFRIIYKKVGAIQPTKQKKKKKEPVVVPKKRKKELVVELDSNSSTKEPPELPKLSSETCSRFDFGSVVTLTVAPMNETTHHCQSRSAQVRICSAVACASGCPSLTTTTRNRNQHNKDTLGPSPF